MKKVRDSNIELLRIFAMLGVVILHYNNVTMGGGLQHVPTGSVNQMLLLALEGLFICAVNLFVLITGYFSCTSRRADPVKAVALLLQVSVFRLLPYFWKLLNGDMFTTIGLIHTLLPDNYFVVLYVAVFLLSPFINQMLRNLSKSQLKTLLIVSLLLFSFWPTLLDSIAVHTGYHFVGLCTLGTNGSGQGYTFVNFALMYLIGASLRLLDIRIKKRYSLSGIILLSALLALAGKFTNVDQYAWAYCNPLVIALAVAIFLLFREFTIRSRVITFLAKGSFTCFLLHMFFLPHYRIPQAVQSSALFLIGIYSPPSLFIYFALWHI